MEYAQPLRAIETKHIKLPLLAVRTFSDVAKALALESYRAKEWI